MKLKIARVYLGMTQEELARELGISRVTINKWENGICYPKTSFWKKASDYFKSKGVDLEW